MKNCSNWLIIMRSQHWLACAELPLSKQSQYKLPVSWTSWIWANESGIVSRSGISLRVSAFFSGKIDPTRNGSSKQRNMTFTHWSKEFKNCLTLRLRLLPAQFFFLAQLYVVVFWFNRGDLMWCIVMYYIT